MESNKPITPDQIRGLLEQRTNKQLYELVKKLDIQFPDRSKASKTVLVKQLMERVGPGMVTADRMKQELERLPPPDQLRAKITRADLEALRVEVVALLRAVRDSQQESAEGLAKHLQTLERDLVAIKHEQSYSTVASLEKFLKEFRGASFDSGRPEDFDSVLNYLRHRGMEAGDIAKIISLLADLRSVRSLIGELSWPEDLEVFYKDLRAEVEQVKTFSSSGIPIATARHLLRKKHGISPESFNTQLLACFRKGWLSLDISSPIGEDPIESIEFEGRRYTTIRSLRRS